MHKYDSLQEMAKLSECKHDCASCASNCSERTAEQTDFREQPHPGSRVKKVIGVVSGKGGVGKSLVTSMLAVLMNRAGCRTAILDADITGPSIPTAFGLKERAQSVQDGILPVESESGVAVMSLNLLLADAGDPVVWRGPVIAGAVKQFWTDVIWGDVDYMFVDMPPGTGDVPLTVLQSLPVDGVVVVTSPQELVSLIVEKAVRMTEMMPRKVPVLALVENMSFFKCPDCDKVHHIYGESHIEAIAAAHGVDTVCRLPIDPSIARAIDAGEVEKLPCDDLAAIAEKLLAL